MVEAGQRRRIENAVSEWGGAVMIGSIPAAFHLLGIVIAREVGAASWLPDLVFWVIALSGTSGMQASFRLSRSRAADAGRLPGALVALSFVLTGLAAFLYGVWISGGSNGVAIPAGGALLFGSVVSSFICDYVVAIRCEA